MFCHQKAYNRKKISVVTLLDPFILKVRKLRVRDINLLVNDRAETITQTLRHKSLNN